MKWILDLATLSVLFCCIPAIVRYRKFEPDLKLISLYVIVSGLVELATHILWNFRLNNLPLLHVYVPVTFVLLLLFYQVLLPNLLTKNVTLFIVTIFVTFSLLDTFWLQGLYSFNTYAINLKNSSMTILAILYFYKIMMEVKILRIERSPAFWINSGLLFYHSGSVLLFTMSNSVIYFSKQIRSNLWTMHALLLIFVYLMISIGLWMYRKS